MSGVVMVNVKGRDVAFTDAELGNILSAAADVVNATSYMLESKAMELEEAFKEAGYDPSED
jgi:hypothetical protein